MADRPVVLIVDDIAENRVALEAILRRDDAEILTASSGRDALEILLERDVAVAILDVMMPEMDGFELAGLIRGTQRTRRVPIIFVTAGARPDFRSWSAFTGYESGAIDFLFKPIDDRVLRSKVDVLVALEKQRRDIDRAREQAERARAETELLLRLARATSLSEKPEDVYGPALDAVRELLSATRSAILTFDESQRMRFRAWRGLSDAYRAAVDGHSPWTASERDPQPILVSNVFTDESMASFRSLFETEGIGAIGFVPLVSRRRLLGKLMLYWEDARSFSEHDEALAGAIATQVAETLERAQLREAERAARVAAEASEQRRAAIQSISDAALAHLEIDPLLRELLARVRRIFQSDTATVLLLDAERKRLEVRACDGIAREEWDRIGVPVGAGVAGAIAEHGRPVAVFDLRDAEVASPVLRERFRSLAGVPLTLKDQVLGVLHVGTVAPRRFTEDEIHLLEMVATRVASALERARLHEALRDSEERHRTLFTVSVYGVITIDEDGIIETANPAAERMFGYPVAEIVGRNVTLLMPEPFRSEHGSYLTNYRRTGTRNVIGFTREVVGQRKDGSQFPMDLGVSEFHIGAKRYFKGIVIDISLRKQLERAREAAVAELQQTLRDNELFAGVLAHDLRNPLGAILVAARLVVKRHGDEATVAEPLRRVISSGERIARMVDQLLDFTRARIGRGFQLDLRDADLGGICAQVLGELELRCPEWKVYVESLGDLAGTWDPDRLAQVVSNLVTNAGEHGTTGTDIRIELDGTDGRSVKLDVHNEGSIPEELLPDVFRPFRGARERRAGAGLGLGAYITREIVRSHGGTVEVASSEAKGTTFRVTLPRRAVFLRTSGLQDE